MNLRKVLNLFLKKMEMMMTTPINEIQTNLTSRNNTQKLLLEMGFELLEIWNKDSGEE